MFFFSNYFKGLFKCIESGTIWKTFLFNNIFLLLKSMKSTWTNLFIIAHYFRLMTKIFPTIFKHYQKHAVSFRKLHLTWNRITYRKLWRSDKIQRPYNWIRCSLNLKIETNYPSPFNCTSIDIDVNHCPPPLKHLPNLWVILQTGDRIEWTRYVHRKRSSSNEDILLKGIAPH